MWRLRHIYFWLSNTGGAAESSGFQNGWSMMKMKLSTLSPSLRQAFSSPRSQRYSGRARRNQKSTATPQNSPVGPPLSVGTPLFQENKPLQGICDTKASASGSRLVHPQLEKTSVLRCRSRLHIMYSTWTSTFFLGIELKSQTSLDWILALPLRRCGIHCPTDDVKDWDDLQSTQHSDGHRGKKPQTCLSWFIVNKSPFILIRFGPWMWHRGWERST